MATSNYSNSSVYGITPQVNFYLDMYVPRSFPISPDDSYYTVPAKYNFRPDLGANDVYGDPIFWWIFQVTNQNSMQDPLFDFTTGKVLRIINKNRLTTIK